MLPYQRQAKYYLQKMDLRKSGSRSLRHQDLRYLLRLQNQNHQAGQIFELRRRLRVDNFHYEILPSWLPPKIQHQDPQEAIR